MKKHFYIFFIIVVLIIQVACNTKTVIIEDKKVLEETTIEEKESTTEYVEEKPYYVRSYFKIDFGADEFGDPDGTNTIIGSFWDKEYNFFVICYDIMLGKEVIAISLPLDKSVHSKYKITFKLDDGSKYEARGIPLKGILFVVDKNISGVSQDFLRGLQESKTMQVYLENTDKRSENYLFTIDTKNFKELYDAINTKDFDELYNTYHDITS